MDDYDGRFMAKADGTDSGCTATKSLSTSRKQIFVDHVSGHTDADPSSLLQVTDEDDLVIWQIKIVLASNGEGFAPNIEPIPITPGKGCKGKVVTSAADCRINIGGREVG